MQTATLRYFTQAKKEETKDFRGELVVSYIGNATEPNGLGHVVVDGEIRFTILNSNLISFERTPILFEVGDTDE